MEEVLGLFGLVLVVLSPVAREEEDGSCSEHTQPARVAEEKLS